MSKILISGGHLTPALAVIDQAKLSRKNIYFVFLGREFSSDTTQQVSHEKEEVAKRGIAFYPTIAPRFHKTYWWRNLEEIEKWWPAFRTAWEVITEEKPDLFLSFGGYLAFPIALICRLRGIPVITHEQTSTKGMANQLIAFLSARVAVSHHSTLALYPAHKTVLTGNPIRPKLLKVAKKEPLWMPKNVDKPILYITGGNQGSEILNTVVGETLKDLTQKWFVIHQCGNPHTDTDYRQQLMDKAQDLTPSGQRNVIVREWMNEEDLVWIFANARLAVSRSGANTTQELILHALPSVLVPLPFSHNNEQLKNATLLSNVGSAVVIEQHNLTPETFIKAVSEVSRRYRSMKQRAEEMKSDFIVDGAKNLLNLVDEVLAEKKFYVEKR